MLSMSVRVPGCQKLQMTAQPGSGTGCFIAVGYPYGNSGRQWVNRVQAAIPTTAAPTKSE